MTPIKKHKEEATGQLVSHGGRWQQQPPAVRSAGFFAGFFKCVLCSSPKWVPIWGSPTSELTWESLFVILQEVWTWAHSHSRYERNRNHGVTDTSHKEKGSSCCFQVLYFSQALTLDHSHYSLLPYGFFCVWFWRTMIPSLWETASSPEMFPKV